MLKKRGWAAEQTRWIFAVIAGGVILLFFYQIITVQQQSTESALAADLAAVLSNVAAGVSTDSTQTVRLPESVKVEYDCSTGNLLLNGAPKRFTGDAALFVEQGLTGDTFAVQVKEFHVPFAAGKAIFLSSSTALDNAPLSILNLDSSVGSINSNPDNTLCGKQQLYGRVRQVAAAHRERMLTSLANSNCNDKYTEAAVIFSEYAAVGGDIPNIIVQKTEGLKTLNAQAIKASCPAIY